MAKTKDPLVNVIVPVWNAGKYLAETIQSIQAQTYKNWELILVDDCSTDNSIDIIKKFQKSDNRIKLLKNKKNSGPAITRNAGIEAAGGDFICFLDADDLWAPKKIEKQLKFMQQHGYAFAFTGYEFATADGEPNGKKVNVPKEITYHQALKNTTISTITVMFDMHKLTKKQIKMPNVGSEDAACWWQVLKITKIAGGLDEILSLYRRGIKSLSTNKMQAVRQVWNLYRKVEKLNLPYSIFCLSCYMFNALRRRI